jgi:hypothetical protein
MQYFWSNKAERHRYLLKMKLMVGFLQHNLSVKRKSAFFLSNKKKGIILKPKNALKNLVNVL